MPTHDATGSPDYLGPIIPSPQQRSLHQVDGSVPGNHAPDAPGHEPGTGWHSLGSGRVGSQDTVKNDERTIFGWAMYDWANSAYATTIAAMGGTSREWT